jgi:glycosyltransferase involved in cell wall biosynthesis
LTMQFLKSIELMVPIYNEEESIEAFVKTVESHLHDLPYNFSFIFVDDGSTDSTVQILQTLPTWPTRIIKLSRNYGKEIAVQCGLDQSNADALVLLDVDLQDPIQLVSNFIQEWENGYEIVYGIRTNRESDSFFQRITSGFFYKIFLKLSNVEFPPHATDARLMARKVVSALKLVKETNRYNKGIFHSIGFNSKGIEFKREKRRFGTSRWNTKKLIGLALDALLSFTTKPLNWSTYLGSVSALIAIFLSIYYTSRKIFFGIGPSGYTSLIVAILFLGAIQLISLGILGLYISQLVGETKKRPLYFVSDTIEINNHQDSF